MISNGSNYTLRQGLVAALDIGTDKICCLIAKPLAEVGNDGVANFELVGIGHCASRGIRSGVVVELDAAESSIRSAVEIAEQMAGENINKVIVGLNSNKIMSRLVSNETSIGGHQIDNADLKRAIDPSGLNGKLAEGYKLIHVVPVGYSIDGNRGIHDPLGMFGERLGVNLHIVSSSFSVIKNLETVINRCHLDVEKITISSLASARATLVDDEEKLGAICIDMGAGTTSISVFFENELVHVSVIPVGGAHITNDIARGLSTSQFHAERMKTLYGNCMMTTSDETEVIQVPLIGEGEHESHQIPRRLLVEIIRPRIEEILELVQKRLIGGGVDKLANRVVLTGGAAQLPGVIQSAGQILRKNVRLALPKPVKGAANVVAGSPFSAAIGLLHIGFSKSYNATDLIQEPLSSSVGRFGKIGQWLSENF